MVRGALRTAIAAFPFRRLPPPHLQNRRQGPQTSGPLFSRLRGVNSDKLMSALVVTGHGNRGVLSQSKTVCGGMRNSNRSIQVSHLERERDGTEDFL